MAKFTLTLEIEVTENWVEDGFDPTNEPTKRAIEQAIQDNILTHATPYEFVVKVKSARKHR